MEESRKQALIEQISEYLDPEEFSGMTIEEALGEIEDTAGNIRVYWACWTPEELLERL